MTNMERPLKRQKLSENIHDLRPTPTIDLANFQRPRYERRNVGGVLFPRVPDVTETAAILEIAVNGASTATQLALPTVDVTMNLDGLGILTLPALSEPSDEPSSSPRSSANLSSIPLPGSSTGFSAQDSSASSSTDHALSTSTSLNSTITPTEKTVTVTATSTFHVTYNNGTFIVPAVTRTASSSDTTDESSSSPGSEPESDFYTGSSSSGSRNTFGWVIESTVSTGDAAATGSNYNNLAGAGATATGPASEPTNSNESNGGTATGPVLTPEQTKIVGGIFGGIAGAAMMLVVLLFVLRWYRQRLNSQRRLPKQLTSGHNKGFQDSGLISAAAPMSQSRSSFFAPAAVAGTKKWRPGSDMTNLTTSTTAPDSEKGFQRVSGRRIPSVLQTGGDQYGGSYGAFEKQAGIAPYATPMNFSRPNALRHHHDLSESSFYHDLEGTYTGNGAKTPSPLVGTGRPASRSAPTTPLYPPVFSDYFSGQPSPRRPSLANLHAMSHRDFADGFGRAFNTNLANPDGVAVFRSSPARTPVTQSPSTSSIRLPIQAPVSADVTMDEDIPEMPLGSPGGVGLGLGLGHGHELGREARRVPSQMSTRNTGSARFREGHCLT